MNVMRHGPYVAKIEYSDEEEAFIGSVVNSRDVIAFVGNSVQELEKEFAETITEHEAFCKEQGLDPNRVFSGNFAVRVSPELHGRVYASATSEGISMAAFVEKSLEEAVHA